MKYELILSSSPCQDLSVRPRVTATPKHTSQRIPSNYLTSPECSSLVSFEVTPEAMTLRCQLPDCLGAEALLEDDTASTYVVSSHPMSFEHHEVCQLEVSCKLEALLAVLGTCCPETGIHTTQLPARCIQCFLWIHAKVQHVGKDLQLGAWLDKKHMHASSTNSVKTAGARDHLKMALRLHEACKQQSAADDNLRSSQTNVVPGAESYLPSRQKQHTARHLRW